MFAAEPSPKPDAVDRAILLFIILLPGLFWACFPIVLSNVPGDVDTWFYFGHFLNLGKYAGTPADFGINYYQTRLPYTIPGYLIFQLFPLALAKVVFGAAIYGVTLWSFLYTLRHHIPRRAAYLAAGLMATDLFFLRTISWNYVDNGVLVYLALSFAALTAACNQPSRRLIWVAAAAFCFSSVLSIHLGTGLLAVLFAAYGIYCLRPQEGKDFGILALAALAGFILCQAIFGLLNVLIWNNDFLYLWEQISIGRHEIKHVASRKTPAQLFNTDGFWLSIHLAIFIAGITAIALHSLRILRLNRFQLVILGSVCALYFAIYLLDLARVTYFLSRSGMYACFMLFPTYLALASILAQGKNISRPAILLVCTASIISLMLRLNENGLPPAWWISLSPGMIGLLTGLFFIAAMIAPKVWMKILALCLIALPALSTQWKFFPTDDIYKTVTALQTLSKGELPRIWVSKDDPFYHDIYVSGSAAFTERGFWIRAENYPRSGYEALEGDRVFILSSQPKTLQQVAREIGPYVDKKIPIRSHKIDLQRGGLWVQEFKIWNRYGLFPQYEKQKFTTTGIDAADLPSRVGKVVGTSRMASERQGDLEGAYLTFGPYAGLAKGKYNVVIQYGPSSGPQMWDITLRQRFSMRHIKKGEFPPTKTRSTVTIPLTLDARGQHFEVLTHYAGKGELHIHSIAVHQAP